MKRFEIIFSSLLIIIGLVCLTMSGTMMLGTGIAGYLSTFIQICLWMGIPLVLTGLLYWRYKKKEVRK